MITLDDNVKIELIYGKIVDNILKKRQYLYHTFYSVNDIDKTINSLIDNGAFLVREPKEAILFDNKKVTF